MGKESLYQKFKKHLKGGGFLYACRRGAGYLAYLVKARLPEMKEKKKTRERFSPCGPQTIGKGDIQVIYDPKGGLSVLWKGHEVTRKSGLSCGIRTLGFWTDSAKGDFTLIERTQELLKIRVTFSDLPLSQIWTIRLKEEGALVWSVDNETTEWLYIEEFRFVALIGNAYKSWVNGYAQHDCPRSDEAWRDLCNSDEASSIVALRFPLEGRPLPFFSMEPLGSQKDFPPLIQSLPLNHSVTLVGFRKPVAVNERKLSPGFFHLFSAKITMSEKEDVLDDRIEALRQNDYQQKLVCGPETELMRGDATARDSVDIVLIQCPPWNVETPPLGIAYLASYLRKYGYTASVCDLNVDLFNRVGEDLKFLWDLQGYDWWVKKEIFQKTWESLGADTVRFLEELFKSVDTPCVGLSVSYPSIYFASEVIKIVKRINKKSKIVVGGWGCASEALRKFFPRELVDAFVVGEGEETLKGYLDALQGKGKMEEVLGIVSYQNPSLSYRPRPPRMDLDNLPWPTYAEFDLDKYKTRALSLFTSRGCIGRCAFCNDWVYLKGYRCRSASHVFEEMRHHQERYRTDAFQVKDLLCNGDMKTLDEWCDLIIRSGMKISWSGQAIARKEMNYDLLKKMKQSGCDGLSYGIESLSDHVLGLMRKIFTSATAQRVIRDTYRAGIHVSVNIIVGFPGETEEDLQETLDALKKNRIYISEVSNLNICLANPESDLDNAATPEKFGMLFLDDEKIRAERWWLKDGTNTYEIRRKRAKKALEVINGLGLPCRWAKT